MNKIQLKIAWLSGALIALACLILPWQYTFQAEGISQVRKPAGYSTLFAPPEPEKSNYRFGVEIDFGRLASEILIISVIGGLAYVSNRKK